MSEHEKRGEDAAPVELTDAEWNSLPNYCRDRLAESAITRIVTNRLRAAEAERDAEKARADGLAEQVAAVEALMDRFSGPESLRADAWWREREVADLIREALRRGSQ